MKGIFFFCGFRCLIKALSDALVSDEAVVGLKVHPSSKEGKKKLDGDTVMNFNQMK